MAATKNSRMLGWSSGRKLVAGCVIFGALLSLMTPAVPFWAALWAVATVVVYLWPDPNSGAYQPLTKPYNRAFTMRSMRKYAWHGLKKHPWRLGPEGDNDGDYGNNQEPHPEQEKKRASMPKIRLRKKAENPELPQPAEEEKEKRLFALNAVAAALAAAASVGLEQILALTVELIPWPSQQEIAASAVLARLGPLATWMTSGRGMWMQVAAAPLGWMAIKAAAAWHRMHIAAKILMQEDMMWRKPPNSSPTAFISNPHIAPHAPRLRDHIGRWRSATILVASMGTAATLTFGAMSALGLQRAAPVALFAFSALLLIGGWAVVRPWVAEQRKPWCEWQKEIADWENNWTAVLGANRSKPVLSAYMTFPEPSDPPKDDDWPPMYKQLVFAMPVGTDYESVKKMTDKLKPAMQCDLVHISPGTMAGTREPTWAYVGIKHELPTYDAWVKARTEQWREWSYSWHVEIDKQTAYHDPALHDHVRAFLFERQLGRAMLDLGIGVLLPAKHPRVRSSSDNAPAYLRFEIPLYGKTTFESLKKNLYRLAESMRAQWLRFELLGSDNIAVGHICAIHPENVEFSRHMEREAKREITVLDWQWWMSAAGLYGADKITTPKMIGVKLTNQRKDDPEATIHKIRFRLPPGLTAKRVKDNEKKLAAASNFPYVSVEEEDMPQDITVLAGHRDPLDDTYLFNDYLDTPTVNDLPMLSEATPGQPRTAWCVGVGTDGTPMMMEWDHEEPHLLVAGASGSGKSMVINSMMTQLLTNNSADDVEIWLMEPKNELHRYAQKKHVRVFIDSHVAEGSIYAVAAQTFAALVDEMERRYALMHDHPDQPQKITEARLLAQRDPERYGHLAFRYIFTVVEECTSFFGKPSTSDDNDAYKLMMAKASELARKARAAGIHLIFATQDPKKEAIPTALKRNCRRVGLRTSDRMGSMVIIDQPGLEVISKPGRGLMTGKHGYTGYRAFLLQAASADEPDIPNELGEHLGRVPDDEQWPKLPPGVEPAIAHEVSLTPAVG